MPKSCASSANAATASDVIPRCRDARRGYELVRRRWADERTFGWSGRNRRLSKDYEARTDVSEACTWFAEIRLLVRRLAHP